LQFPVYCLMFTHSLSTSAFCLCIISDTVSYLRQFQLKAFVHVTVFHVLLLFQDRPQSSDEPDPELVKWCLACRGRKRRHTCGRKLWRGKWHAIHSASSAKAAPAAAPAAVTEAAATTTDERRTPSSEYAENTTKPSPEGREAEDGSISHGELELNA